MFRNQTEGPGLPAAEVRSYLVQLLEERSLALGTGMADIAAYLTDLDEEIEQVRSVYVATAVTEIATLRGELFGPQVG
jgi:hypothetical protein